MATIKKNTHMSIKTIWGIAKSEELHLSSDNLHEIVYAQVGKEHISQLTQREIGIIVCYLTGLRDSVLRAEGNKVHAIVKGNTATINQRKKIYKLTEGLGSKGKQRVKGLCLKMFQVDAVEWLNYQQCSKLIEAIKAILERESKEEA